MTTVVFDGRYLAADGQLSGELSERKRYHLAEHTPRSQFTKGDPTPKSKIFRDVKKMIVRMNQSPTYRGAKIIAVSGSGDANMVAAAMQVISKTRGEIFQTLGGALHFYDVAASSSRSEQFGILIVVEFEDKTTKAEVLGWKHAKLTNETEENTVAGIVSIGSGSRAAWLYKLLNPKATAMDCVGAAALVDPWTGLSVMHWDAIGEKGATEHTRELPTLKALKKVLYKNYIKRSRAIEVPFIVPAIPSHAVTDQE